MSEPTPVISSTNVMESWSSWKPASAWKPATGTQWKTVTVCGRAPVARPSIDAKSATPTPKEANAASTPSQWPQRSVRRPPSSSTAAPAAGSATSTGMRSFTVSQPPPLQLHEVGVVDRGRVTGAEDTHDDGQADHDLGGGDHHGEEGDDLPVQVAVQPGEGDQGQVGGVEHELDAHEENDGVAPDEDARGADGEEQRREIEVVDRVHFSTSRGAAGSELPGSVPASRRGSRPRWTGGLRP